MLKPYEQTPDKDLPGRSQAVKAAIQHDDILFGNDKTFSQQKAPLLWAGLYKFLIKLEFD